MYTSLGKNQKHQFSFSQITSLAKSPCAKSSNEALDCILIARNLPHFDVSYHKLLSLSLSRVPQSCPTLCDPMGCPLWNFPGKTTEVSCHFLLQGIFPTQGSNPCHFHLPLWQADSLPLHHLGNSRI